MILHNARRRNAEGFLHCVLNEVLPLMYEEKIDRVYTSFSVFAASSATYNRVHWELIRS